MNRKVIFTILSFLCLFAPSITYADNYPIRVVGSGSVYPIYSLIAERFAAKTKDIKTPIVEANGTGSGFKIFCAPISQSSPSIATASRKIKDTESAVCKKNNVGEILEIQLGFDGLTLVHNISLGKIVLSKVDLFLALAKYIPDSKGKLISNPYITWQDVNVNLPAIPIKVLGPSSGSGTRDAFFELVLHKACNELYNKKIINDKSKVKDIVCNSVRSDGVWIDGGEAYALSVKKVINSSNTFAIVSYNFYESNQHLVSAAVIDGIYLTEASLANKAYPLLRPLFIYLKIQDLKVVYGVQELLAETISQEAIGSNGYLKSVGLIALSDKEALAQNNAIKYQLHNIK